MATCIHSSRSCLPPFYPYIPSFKSKHTTHDIKCILQRMSTLISNLHSEYRYFTQDGWAPLITASFEGHVDIVRMLIEAKAQINAQDKVCYSYIPPILYTAYSCTR